jgi:glucans biosynthesis protein
MTRLVFDFAGPKLAGLTADSGVKGVVQASRGQVQNLASYPVVGTARWRLMFDLAAPGFEPVDLRAYLARGPEAISETCLYQIFPSEGPARSPA